MSDWYNHPPPFFTPPSFFFTQMDTLLPIIVARGFDKIPMKTSQFYVWTTPTYFKIGN
jgi:hypothetical protein